MRTSVRTNVLLSNKKKKDSINNKHLTNLIKINMLNLKKPKNIMTKKWTIGILRGIEEEKNNSGDITITAYFAVPITLPSAEINQKPEEIHQTVYTLKVKSKKEDSYLNGLNNIEKDKHYYIEYSSGQAIYTDESNKAVNYEAFALHYVGRSFPQTLYIPEHKDIVEKLSKATQNGKSNPQQAAA